MSVPVWSTPSGSLGTVSELNFFALGLEAYDSVDPSRPLSFELVAGTPPSGVHIDSYGTIAGSPDTILRETDINDSIARIRFKQITSKFAVRARVADYYETFTSNGNATRTQFILTQPITFDITRVLAVINDNAIITTRFKKSSTGVVTVTLNRALAAAGETLVISLYQAGAAVADRTFSMTIVGSNPPKILKFDPLGTYFDGQYVDIDITALDLDIEDTITWSLSAGQLPDGVTLDKHTGKISGFIRPYYVTDAVRTEINNLGFDDEQFDGRTYDNDAPTVTTYPILSPSTDIYSNYQFTITVSDGNKENAKSYNLRVISSSDIKVSSDQISVDDNTFTVDSKVTYSPLMKTEIGEIGPVLHDNNFMYKFDAIDYNGDMIEYFEDNSSETGFDNSFDGAAYDIGSIGLPTSARDGFDLTLDADTGWIQGTIPVLPDLETTYKFNIRARKKDVRATNPATGEQTYYKSRRKQFQLTVSGQESVGVVWDTPANLGSMDNGAVSELEISATAQTSNTIYYELLDGSHSRLPQGLKLLDNGLLIGRTTFSTFECDAGTTTFDKKNFYISETTIDRTYSFTVRAYDVNIKTPTIISHNITNITSAGVATVTSDTYTKGQIFNITAMGTTVTGFPTGTYYVIPYIDNNGSPYYTERVTGTSIMLASTYANAMANPPVPISVVTNTAIVSSTVSTIPITGVAITGTAGQFSGVLPVITGVAITGTAGQFSGVLPSITGVAITGAAGQFSCAATTLAIEDAITISGTLGGTGTIDGYTNDPKTYYIIATNGSTTFTLSATPGGAAITTMAGTPTGLTYNTATLAIGNGITISGTLSGTGSITGYINNLKTYYIIATNGVNTFTLSATPGGEHITTTAGTPTGLTYNTATLAIGNGITISGTLGGTGTIPGYINNPKTYYIIATNGVNTFTLSATLGGAAITTTTGTPTGLTYNIAYINTPGVAGSDILLTEVTTGGDSLLTVATTPSTYTKGQEFNITAMTPTVTGFPTGTYYVIPYSVTTSPIGVAITGTAGQFSCAETTLAIGDAITISGTITGVAITGVAITSTAGQFSCAATTLAIGNAITISGTLGGTGHITGYTNPKTYYIIATNGSTTFTLSATLGGAAITTMAGTPTGVTYTLGGTGSITGYTDNQRHGQAGAPKTYYIITTNGSTTFTLSASQGGAAITTTAGTPTGLTYNTTRFTKRVTGTSIMLASTYANATAQPPVPITGVTTTSIASSTVLVTPNITYINTDGVATVTYNTYLRGQEFHISSLTLGRRFYHINHNMTRDYMGIDESVDANDIGIVSQYATEVAINSAKTYHSNGTVFYASTPNKFYKLCIDVNMLLKSVAITGTTGQFSCESTPLAVNDKILITGTLGGTGSILGYTNPKTYYINTILTATSAGSFVAGDSYTIKTVGTTDFTLIGAASTAVVTGSVATNVLTVTAVTSGALTVGTAISGTGITAGTTISSFGSGTGGTGTYNLSNTMTAGSTTVTAQPTVGTSFTATGVGTGTGVATPSKADAYTLSETLGGPAITTTIGTPTGIAYTRIITQSTAFNASTTFVTSDTIRNYSYTIVEEANYGYEDTAGLTIGTYYIINDVTGTRITLASSYINAMNNTPISTVTASGTITASSVIIKTIYHTVNTTKTFTLALKKAFVKPYENLYIAARLPKADRLSLSSYLENTEIIPTTNLYRPEDSNFGLAKDLRLLMANGVNPASAADYVGVISKAHYNKQLYFGKAKTARVLNNDNSVRYEIVYLDVLDDLRNSESINVTPAIDVTDNKIPFSADMDSIDVATTVTTDGVSSLYPNNLANMRRFITRTLGQVNKALPDWMTDMQEDGRVLGFTTGCVLAYVVPGTAKKIAYRLNNSDLNFNNLHVVADRYVWDNNLTRNYNKTDEKFLANKLTTFDLYTDKYVPSTVSNMGAGAEFIVVSRDNLKYKEVTIVDGGNEYRVGDQITIPGSRLSDGIRSIAVSGSFSGKTTAIQYVPAPSYPVTIAPPTLAGGVQATANITFTAVFLDSIVVSGTFSGKTTATPYAVTISAPNLATGVQATANIIFPTATTGIVTVVNPGSGYTSAPTATCTLGGGTGTPILTALLSPSAGIVTVVDPGSGYEPTLAVALSGVAISGTTGQFTCASTTLVVGDTLTITGTLGGTGSITGYTTGRVYVISETNGTTTFTLRYFGPTGVTNLNDAIVATAVGTPTGLTYTRGYTPPATCALGGGTGTVTLTAVVGGINSIVVSGTFSGKTTATPYAVTISAPNITGGVQATANIIFPTATTGIVTVVNPGSGYTSAPTATCTLGGGTGTVTLTAAVGGINSIAVSGSFSGKTTAIQYVPAPSYPVTISAPNIAGGVQATANITFPTATTGIVTITERGSGYTSVPTATCALGGGTGTPTLTVIGGVPSFDFVNDALITVTEVYNKKLIRDWKPHTTYTYGEPDIKYNNKVYRIRNNFTSGDTFTEMTGVTTISGTAETLGKLRDVTPLSGTAINAGRPDAITLVGGTAIPAPLQTGAPVSTIAVTGTGAGLTINITKLGTGVAYAESNTSVSIAALGGGYSPADLVKVSGAVLGGTSPANDLTIRVTDVKDTIYTPIPTQTLTGSGVGATVTVTKLGSDTTYTTDNTIISVETLGIGYTAGDTLKVLGTYLGGTTPTNDLVFAVLPTESLTYSLVNTVTMTGIGTSAKVTVTKSGPPILTAVQATSIAGTFSCSDAILEVNQTVTISGTMSSSPTMPLVQITGTAGTFSCTNTTLAVGQSIKISGNTPNVTAPALTSVQITSIRGTFSCDPLASLTSLYVGQEITISDALAGTGSIAEYINPPATYYIIATDGHSTFTLSTSPDPTSTPLTTVAGTTTGATFTIKYGLPPIAGYVSPTTYYITATNGINTFTLSDQINGLPIITNAGTPTGWTYTHNIISDYSNPTTYYITNTDGKNVFTLSKSRGGSPIVTMTGTPSGLIFSGTGTSYTRANTVIDITVPGKDYFTGDIIKVLGTELGGTSPANDLTFTAVARYMQPFDDGSTIALRLSTNSGITVLDQQIVDGRILSATVSGLSVANGVYGSTGSPKFGRTEVQGRSFIYADGADFVEPLLAPDGITLEYPYNPRVADPESRQKGTITTFDRNSMQFFANKDAYATQDQGDAYLKWPKMNIFHMQRLS